MTEKQKKASLKAEDWKRCGLEFCSGWRDPVGQECWTIESAYRIASRRRRQREARALRKAGWHWRCASRFHAAKAGYVHADYRGRYTRQEALQTLEAQP